MADSLSASRAPRARRRKHPWLWQIFLSWRERGTAYILDRAWLRIRGPRQYDPDWIRAQDTLSAKDIALIRQRIGRFVSPPLVSIIMPIAAEPPHLLRRTIDSIVGQLYERWELHLVFERAAQETAHALFEQYAASDRRVKLVLSGTTTNDALRVATGEWTVRLAPRGKLAPHALYLIAEEIAGNPDANLIYTDEDEIDETGARSQPRFKTDWNPDLFLSQNYLGSLVALRSERVREAGGFRPGFGSAGQYDLTLRIVGRIAAGTIRHLPFILFNQYKEAPFISSADPDAQAEQSRRALEDHLVREAIDGTVTRAPGGRTFRVQRKITGSAPSVSLVIPTRDRADLLKGAIDSILERTEYAAYEIVVVDNQSTEPKALAYLASVERDPRVRVLRYDRPFNFSAINNFAARECRGEILGLLNNDVVVINADWMTELVSHARRPEVGAVGGMLYYPDDIIQHAGIIVGYGGTAINYGGLPRGSAGYLSRMQAIQNYSAVTGACLFTRAKVFAEVGGLNDEQLAVAFNDVDYCLRVRERGYLVTWTPYAELYHLESASRGDDFARDKIRRFKSEVAYLGERWAPVLEQDPYYNPNLTRMDGLFQLGRDVRVRRPWRPHGS